MNLRRIVMLMCVVMLSAMLKDLVVPRECLEAWVDRWLGQRSHVVAQRQLPGDVE